MHGSESIGSFIHSSKPFFCFITQSVFSMHARRESAASLHFFAWGREMFVVLDHSTGQKYINLMKQTHTYQLSDKPNTKG